MPNNRIGYIDALRGFTMYLVVFSHIWTFGYYSDDSNSFRHILINFFLVLFFFISGFCAYKKEDTIWTTSGIKKLIHKKFIQLIIPTFAFFAILCYWRGRSMTDFLNVATAEYWFTFQLFFFFLFYYATMMAIRKLGRIQQSVVLIIIASLLYIISFSHVVIECTELGTSLFHYWGMENWREYIFFTFGILARKHLGSFKKLTDNAYVMAGFVLIFFFMVFCADKVDVPFWKPIRKLIYGGASIIVIFTLFRKYEQSFDPKNRFGYYIQYVGKRTLDIYMIHYFFLPRHLDFLGKFFVEYSNPSLEFIVTTILSIIVIWISLVIGNTIRLSPKLAHYLLGDK